MPRRSVSILVVGSGCVVSEAWTMRKLVFISIFGLWGLTVIVSAQAPNASPIWTVSPVDRSKIDYSQMPLWAYGVAERPNPADPQAVHGAPSVTPAAPMPPAE